MAHGEMSRRENRQVAVAAATLGPWRTAAGVGALVGATDLVIDLIDGDWSLSMLAGPAGVALFFFFLVGTVGGRLRRDTADRRLQKWANEHPWQAALPAAGGMLFLNTLAQLFLGDAGVFEAFFLSLFPAAMVLGVAGVVGSVKRARAKD
ncbi:hypothetical protein [Kitasatospora purpeofusca]|uniref:hypothetical protein n=2 Tax=Kitasatospora purpeofusca TaxID=67352 RepID=UPI002258A9C1|nr:hypothetical protein [Kitasatospora purpeofusca]MCX4753520.1 hypothetical protein [Kitasatospora purpeofusca]WSR33014.1 hypothetical protein OG715_19690 [Kitasatospora purpeofusca]